MAVRTGLGLMAYAAVVAMLAGCPGATTGSTLMPKARAFNPDAATQRLSSVPPFYIPGETISWEVAIQPQFKSKRLPNIKVSAEAVMAVGKPGVLHGKRVIIVRSRVKAGGLIVAMGGNATQEFLTHISTKDSNVTYRLFKADMMGKSETIETRFFEGGYWRIRRRRGRAYRRKKTIPAGEVAYDVQAILGVLRGWNPKLGSYAYFNALTENTYCRHTVRFSEKVSMQTRMGRSRAIRIDGRVRRLRRNLTVDKNDKGRPYTLWVSDDAERRPLRIAIQMKRAKVQFEIVGYKR